MNFALSMSPNDFDFIVNCCLFLGFKVKMEKAKSNKFYYKMGYKAEETAQNIK